MPYRADVEALRQRHARLEREIQDRRERAAELESMRREETDIARELEETRRLLEQMDRPPSRRGLPVLEDVVIASPCNVSWDAMAGDGRVRFCGLCRKNVYNLSGMSREDAEELLAERADDGLCVRMYQRADGTVMTTDCEVGRRKKRIQRAAAAAFGTGVLAAAGATMFAAHAIAPRPVMGAVAVVPDGRGLPAIPVEETHETTPRNVQHVMGTYAPPARDVDARDTPPPPAKHLMGHVRRATK